MRALFPIAALLFTLSAGAAPTISSISPSSGPASGGTAVTIKGTGFEFCPVCSPPTPPVVRFGGIEALQMTLVDPTTIVAVTPPSLATTVSVTVQQYDGTAALPNSFTFTGDAGVEPILIPVYSPPIAGAFGSQFITEVTASNRSDTAVSIFGIDESCFIVTPPGLGPSVPRLLTAGVGHTAEITPGCSDWPARLLYVSPAEASRVSFNVRVHDTSRNASSHGTAIPVVRMNELTLDPIVLPGIPNDPRFRAMLRIYSRSWAPVRVTINGATTQHIVTPGPTVFEPGYLAIPIPLPLETNVAKIDVVVRAGQTELPITTLPLQPVWAFITVTNNTTQEITTITPDLP
jgi:hypothetical protein